MTEENLDTLIVRLSSFAWRLWMMVLALVIDFALQNLGLFNLPGEIVLILGLVLGEVSKHINNKLTR